MTQPAPFPATAPGFRVDRNLRLLYALGAFTMAQPGLAIWVIYLLDFRHLTLTQVGTMEAFYWGVKLLLEMPSGAFADRFGRRATFAVGLVIEGAGVTTFAFASNFTILLVSYVLWSAGFSFRSGNDQAYIYDALVVEDRAPEFSARAGMFEAMNTAAFTIAGIGGGWLASVTTLQVPLMIGVVPYLAGGVCVALMQEPPRVIGAHHDLRYVETIRTALRALRDLAVERSALLTQIALSTAMISGILLMQPFLQQHGVPLAWFGMVALPWAGGVLWHGGRSGADVRRQRSWRIMVGGTSAALLLVAVIGWSWFRTTQATQGAELARRQALIAEQRAQAAEEFGAEVTALPLRGRLLDKDGNPIPNSQLWIVSPSCQPDRPHVPILKQMTTDAQGRFQTEVLNGRSWQVMRPEFPKPVGPRSRTITVRSTGAAVSRGEYRSA